MKNINGKVLWYSDRLGYGVICGTNGETYFIHHEDIVSSSIDEGRHRNHLSKDEKRMKKEYLELQDELK